MLAPAPTRQGKSVRAFNRRRGAPFGHPGHRYLSRLGARSRLSARAAGPYAWQKNNTTRVFEYPWVFQQIQRLGDGLVVVDLGASVAGMQFTLARAGHEVHAVDPGMNATGRGWELDPRFHHFLAETYRAPVQLHPTTLDEAPLADGSVDVILSVSTLEHFGSEDFARFAQSAKRVLRPHGAFVLTIDLFLDLAPFTDRTSNEFGVNVNVASLLTDLDAELVVGNPAELHGFEEFNARLVQANLSDYFIGYWYPAMAQCLVARRRH